MPNNKSQKKKCCQFKDDNAWFVTKPTQLAIVYRSITMHNLKESTQFVIYNLSRADARPSTFWLQKCNMGRFQGH